MYQVHLFTLMKIKNVTDKDSDELLTVGDLNFFENHAAILSELGWDNNGRDGTEEGQKKGAL